MGASGHCPRSAGFQNLLYRRFPNRQRAEVPPPVEPFKIRGFGNPRHSRLGSRRYGGSARMRRFAAAEVTRLKFVLAFQSEPPYVGCYEPSRLLAFASASSSLPASLPPLEARQCQVSNPAMLRSKGAHTSSSLVTIPILRPRILQRSIHAEISSRVGFSGFSDFTSEGNTCALKKRLGPKCIWTKV